MGPILTSLMPSNISTDPTPTLQVTNLNVGATVKIYGGPNCTSFLESFTANSETFSFELQNPLEVGTYQFSARYEVDGIASACSPPISHFHYDPNFSLVKMKQLMRSVQETDGIINVELELTPAKPYDVTVTVNFGGTNIPLNTAFAYSSKQVVIPAGSTSAVLPVQLIDDGIKRLDNMLNVNIEAVSTSQVRIDTQPSTRVYIQDSSATFSTIAKLQMGGVSSTGGCALLTSGQVKCWGDIGGALTGNQPPTVMDPGVNYMELSKQSNTTCAITTLGSLKCWDARPGNGSATSISAPFAHAGSYNWVQVFQSAATCATRTNGDLYCWGSNTNGRLGNGNAVDQLSPVNIDPGVAYASTITGGNFSCGLTASQQVKCWGLNTDGQLGDTTTTSRMTPGAVIDGGQTYLKLSLDSGSTVCGITTGQKLKCWGKNDYGQLGDGTTTNNPTPAIIDGAHDYVDVQADGSSTCGLTTAGEVNCWGLNSSGQLGDGTLVNKLVPTAVAGSHLFSKIYPASSYRCGIVAITNDLKCWGNISLGDAPAGTNLTPFSVNSLISFSDISHGQFYFGGVSTLGFSVFAGGQFGLVSFGIPSKQDPERKFLSTTGLCRIDENNKLFCRTFSGDGTSTRHTTFIAVDAGNTYTKVDDGLNGTDTVCAIRTDGKLFCWGENYDGQVGDGTTTHRYTMMEIDAGQTYTDVSVGSQSTCGIRTDGQLLCWGTNTNGGLGDNTTISKYSPTLIDVGSRYDKVTVDYQACGIIRISGELRCWGEGFRGKVGHNSAADQLTPLTIDAGTFYKDVQAIDQHTCGITLAGALKCWGRNFKDEVGDGTGVNRFVPTLIDIGTTYEKIGGGSSDHTCALTSTGTIKCWGENGSGQSGQSLSGPPTDTPQVVAGLPPMVEIFSGSDTSCGIDSTGYLWCWGQYDYSDDYGLGLERSSSGLLILRNLRIEGN